MKSTEVEEALRVQVEEAKRSTELANRLVKWFEDLAAGNETVEDMDRVRSRVSVIFDAISIEEKDLEE